MSTRISSDTIPSIENDLLGRIRFAKEIKKAIIVYSQKNKDAFAISITGEWGSGKSTLLSFIKSLFKIEEENTFKIIEFNPWMFYKNESIKQAFLIELAISLRDFETRRTNVSKHLKDFISAFKWIKYVNAAAGNVQDGLESFFDFLGKTDSVNEIKDEIEKILKKSKKKIIVLIDDMDRLMPEQITEVLQTISLITNFSNIVYLLAFDKQIVIDALNKQFSNRGQDYLEKIIQVDYEMPKLNDQKLEGIFNGYINEFQKHYKIEFDKYALQSLWSYHGMKDYFKNIRDFKRYFNALSFRLPVIADDVNPTDFLVIESIRIFDYKSFENFYNSYNTNLRKRELSHSVLTSDQFSNINSIASDLLKAIFPKSTLEAYRNDTNSKRLHDPAYFQRYFSLLRNDNDISEKNLREIINRSNVRRELLQEAVEYNRIENLIHRLSDNELNKHYPNYDYSLINDLITFFNLNPKLFEAFTNKVSDMIINLVCGNKKKNEFLKSFFFSFEKYSTPVNIIHIYFFHFIRLFYRENRRFRSDHYSFDEYYKKHYEYIEKKYLPIFKSIMPQTLFLSFTEDAPFIKYLYQINYSELFPNEYISYLSSLLQDSHYIVYLAERLVWVNDKNILVRYRFEYKDTLFPDLTFIDFYNKLKEVEEVELNDNQKAIRKYLLNIDISKYPDLNIPDADE